MLGGIKHNEGLNEHANFERFWMSLLTLLRVSAGRLRELPACGWLPARVLPALSAARAACWTACMQQAPALSTR